MERKYFELGCKRYDRNGPGRERRPLDEGGLRRRSQRDRCTEGLASLSKSSVRSMALINGAYDFLERLLGL